MRFLCLLLILIGPLALAQSPDFAKMAAERGELEKKGDWAGVSRVAEAHRETVRQMLREDRLKTGAEFFAAAKAVADPFGFFEYNQLQHELVLAALLLGEEQAIKRVTFTWDFTLHSMAQLQRFGNLKRPGPDGKPVPDRVDPDGPSPNLTDVFTNTAEARTRAAAAKDNAELQKICDEDQAVRQGEMTQEKFAKMIKEDPIRRARVLELLKANVPTTARDFYNCSLVLQHGGEFRSYMMAHELILAAAILGEKNAPWLVSRTYDRMLLSAGHRQRFGTQSNSGGLMPMTEDGPSDTMRVLLGAKKLAELKPRAAGSSL